MTFSSNAHDVADDVRDVADDLKHEMRKRIAPRMRKVWADARGNVIRDSHAGTDGPNLVNNIRLNADTSTYDMSFSVGVDMGVVPYAGIVEYGSGDRARRPFKTSKAFYSMARQSSSRPPDWPYDAPDVSEDNISGFAYYIEQWMRNKTGMQPETGSYRLSALKIAKTIIDAGTFAHPYLRPAYFDNEKFIKRAAKHAVTNATR